MKILINDIILYSTGIYGSSKGKVFKVTDNTVYIRLIKNGIVTNIKNLVWIKNVIKVVK